MGKEEGKNCTNGVLTTGGFVEVNIDTFELKIRIAAISAGRVDTVLVAYHLYREKKGTEGHESPSRFTASRSNAVIKKNRSYLPKLGADLVAALATLDVDDLAGR